MLLAHHMRLDGNVPSDALLFFGSSSVQSLAVGELAERAVNFGIGSETIPQLMERLPRYRSLASARGVVLAIGYDLAESHPRPRCGATQSYFSCRPPKRRWC
jgi:hypothetical protein